MSTEHTRRPVAEVDGLSISYRAGRRMVPVAIDVSFTLHRGGAVALVGESGSGKTTVATSLLAALRPGSEIVFGAVRVSGDDVFGLKGDALRRLRGGRVAMVAQNAGHALTPSMRAGAQIAEVLAAHGMDSGPERVEQIARRVHLEDPALLQRYPHELSGGQQQRVAIAAAIAAEPSVLVLDEPTTALDVITQRGILDLIAELRENLGVAVVLVSHDLGVVAEIADSALVLRRGEVVEQGPAEQLLSRPEHAYTRKLVAAAPKLSTEQTRSDEQQSGGEVVLSCEGLNVRYSRNAPLAVEGFTAEIRRGETLAVVGQSGSGKSTVAKALAGLLAADAGAISFLPASSASAEADASDLVKPAGKRSRDTLRAVQLIFQNADLALNPRRTVGDAIARPMRVFRLASGRYIRERVTALLEEVGLDGSFADRVPAQLSGGQRQRIGIARALAAEPSLLIADEITTALDVSVQADVLDLLADLQRRRGLSCLFISHDLAVVQRVAHRVAVMKDGSVVETGPVDRILSAPEQAYTRRLLEATVHVDAAA
ncbi:ATP-binding cassette domain-containing protein [Nesterenkonia populi]